MEWQPAKSENQILGINLVSESGQQYWINSSAWGTLLALAERYGWQPTGTSLSQQVLEHFDGCWDGSYTTSDGQVVCREDAYALASSLERALADANPHDETPDRALESAMAQAGFLTARLELVSFLQQSREAVVNLITFCRGGSFEIW
jgi:hypothetical protein